MNNIIKRVWNQNRMASIEDLQGMAFQAEDGGHTFEISGINDANEAVSLSGTVAGVFMRPDGTDVALTGTASDGVVSVTLDDACYAVAGRFGLTIFVTADSKTTCVYACVGTVAQTSYGTVAGDTPQDVVDLINAINSAITALNAAIGEIPADYSALMASIAPTYSSTALYTKGSYAWYEGVLYRTIVDISTAESFTAAHWTQVALSNDVKLIRNAFDIESHVSQNLLNPAEIETGCYYWTNGRNGSGSYNSTPYIPVEEGQKIWLQTGNDLAASRSNYRFRFVTGYDETKTFVTGSNATYTDDGYTVPSGVHYIIGSVEANKLNAGIKPVVLASDSGTVLDYIPYYAPYDSVILKAASNNDEHINEVITASKRLTNGFVNTFNIDSDNHGTTEELQDMFGYSVQFRGTINTFSGIIVAHGYNQTMGGYIKVTPTDVEYYLGTEANPRLSEAHGLTIKDYIAIRVDAKEKIKADITISTNGGVYTKTNQTWDVRKGQLSVRSVGTNVLTDCVLSYYCKAWECPIQIYGDSYIGVYNDKWTRYLVDNGWLNHLENGYPGRNSATALFVAKIVLANSNPQKILWCLGMNDGDNGSVNASWKSCVEELIGICTSRKIELILATIPNVPTVDNTYKNAYVRDSGYRYIDFASAVGASSDTTWYDNMLSNDNVHPSQYGAVALFNQAIADVPELMQ